MKHANVVAVASLLALAGAAVAQTLPPVNGQLKPQYGPLRWVNTTPTQFGDGNLEPVCEPLGVGIVVALDNSGPTPGVGGGFGPADTATAAAFSKGIELKIPLASLGNPTGPIKIAGLITCSGYGCNSNQVIGGIGGQAGATPPGTATPAVANTYGGTANLDFSAIAGNQFISVSGPATTSGATIDGVLDSSFYGTPLFVQDTQTNYGSASTVGVYSANGSEIAAAYARVGNDGTQNCLYVFVAGHLESNYNKLVLLFDSGLPNGQNPILNTNNNSAGLFDGGPNGVAGLKLDTGFSANYWFACDVGNPGPTFYAKYAKLGTSAQGGASRDLVSSGTTTNPLVSAVQDPCPPAVDYSSGSEIDALYATRCGDYLYILATGNLESNGNRFNLFIDAGQVSSTRYFPSFPNGIATSSAGQNQLLGTNLPFDFGKLRRLGPGTYGGNTPPDFGNGLKFSPNFNADYWISFQTGGNPTNFSAWASFLTDTGALVDDPGSTTPQYFDYGAFTNAIKNVTNPLSFDGLTCVRTVNNACTPNGSGTQWNPDPDGAGPLQPAGLDIVRDATGTWNALTTNELEIYSSFAPRLISQNPFDPLFKRTPGQGGPQINFAVPGLIQISLNNSNRGGITSVDASNARQVGTGLEWRIRLDELGWDGTSPIRITGFISSNDLGFISNQWIGGTLPASYATANLAEPRILDLSGPTFTGGPYYVELSPADLNPATSCQDAPTGACCFTGGACLSMSAAQCSSALGTFAGVNIACSVSVCTTQPSGVCCRGVTCTTGLTAATCSNVNSNGVTIVARFQSASNACNTGGSLTGPCCYGNFDGSADGVQVADIFAFLSAFFSNSPYAVQQSTTGGAAPTGVPGVPDIFNFLSAWFGAGGCV